MIKYIFWLAFFTLQATTAMAQSEPPVADDADPVAQFLARQRLGMPAPRIGATIEQLQDDGSLKTEDGGSIFQWGLEFDQGSEFGEFIRGRTVSCRELFKRGTASVADCHVWGKGHGPLTSELLDLFVWAPVFGWAERQCDTNEQPQNDAGQPIGGRIDELTYTCVDTENPIRTREHDSHLTR